MIPLLKPASFFLMISVKFLSLLHFVLEILLGFTLG
jgi:hypothetical protein